MNTTRDPAPGSWEAILPHANRLDHCCVCSKQKPFPSDDGVIASAQGARFAFCGPCAAEHLQRAPG